MNTMFRPQDPNTLYVISPIWPTQANPALGTFVKTISEGLERNGWRIDTRGVGNVAIGGRFNKALRYGKVCLGSIGLLFAKQGVIYVHLPTWFTLFLWPTQLLRPLPIIINIHGSEIHSRKGLARLFWPITRAYLHRAALVVVPSETFSHFVKTETGLQNCLVSPSGGIDDAVFRPVEERTVRAQLGIAQQATVYGYVSRLVSGKGWQIFLDALQQSVRRGQDAYGLVIGVGPDRARLISEIEDRNLSKRVFVIGAVPQNSLYLYYASMDVFLFTSKIERVDTLGLVAIEAMKCGTPCIALDTPLTREYIEDGVNGGFASEWTGTSFFAAAQPWTDRRKSQPRNELQRSVSLSVARYDSKSVAERLSQSILRAAR